MFLFTSPSAKSPAAPEPQQGETPLVRSFRSAAETTGVSFDYLMKTAKRESNLNPEAKASSSSATGLFQFIEQTWLGLVKRKGAANGLAEEANAIQRDGSGRYAVPDSDMRQQILALRRNPDLAAKFAGIFTRENRDALRETFGREPTGGELYIAHFLGAGGARELIGMAQNAPDQPAARAFPEAAAANRSIFFDRNGRTRSAREVYARLVSYHEGDAPSQPVTNVAKTDTMEDGPATRSPLAVAPADATRRDNAHHGLFRAGGTGQAAADLRKTWIGVAESRIDRNAPSFFPRTEGVKVAAAGAPAFALGLMREPIEDVPVAPLLADFVAKAPEVEAKDYPAVDAPLPPLRPAELGPGAHQPLDLTRAARTRR